ncbi:MAG: putative toxin-antitoxin system toxin component, PIN family [Deltaproteobacteria bacterium]|nr:putative toxin-antitoxin system toxin component, PIN family [Deltaproteobacteria bacterium]
MTMRVVIDTNVFISSFFGGIPRQIIDHWFSGKFTLCVSRPILKEYFDVLGRFQFEREDFFGRLINAFEKGPNILYIDDPKEENWIKGDPADNKFIACALSLHAEYIVSGDIHLKRAEKIGNVEIIPPREMLRLIETG